MSLVQPFIMPEFDPAALSVESIPAVMSQLAAWQSQLAARLMTVPAPREVEPDEMLTPIQAAELLKQSPRWLSRHARTLPFVKRISQRRFVCSRNGIAKWLGSRRA